MTHKKLLQNIYKAARHHEELNRGIKNNLLNEDWVQQKAEGSADAYAYMAQMILYPDTIGATDYDKVFKTKTILPWFLNEE